MTSDEYARKREERRIHLDRQREEQRIFDNLPSAIRDAINSCEEPPPKPSVVLKTLLRGVDEARIVELILRKTESKA